MPRLLKPSWNIFIYRKEWRIPNGIAGRKWHPTVRIPWSYQDHPWLSTQKPKVKPGVSLSLVTGQKSLHFFAHAKMRLSGLKTICHNICPKHKPNIGLITKCFPLNRSILWAFLDLLHEQMKAGKVATLRQASWASHCAQERKGNQDTEKPKWAPIDRTKESKHNSQKWRACRSSSFAGVVAFIGFQ